MLKGIDKFMLLEGLSDKGKDFLKIIKIVLGMKPQELLRLARVHSEGIFYFVDTDTIVEKVSAPKGEMAEIARGTDHRAVAMRFRDAMGRDKVFYFVIPLLDFSGAELTDNKAKSGIQSRMKEIMSGIDDGQDMNDVLKSIFMTPQAAIAQLKATDRNIKMGSEAEREQLAQQAPDPLRDSIASLLRLIPDTEDALEMVLKMRPGIMGRLLDGYSWDQDTRAEFIAHAAELGVEQMENTQAIKVIAELALAYMARSALERAE